MIINYFFYFLIQEFSKDNFIDHYDFKNLLGIIFLVLGFFILGFYDDKIGLSPNTKLFLSLMIVLIVLFLNINVVINERRPYFYLWKQNFF